MLHTVTMQKHWIEKSQRYKTLKIKKIIKKNTLKTNQSNKRKGQDKLRCCGVSGSMPISQSSPFRFSKTPENHLCGVISNPL